MDNNNWRPQHQGGGEPDVDGEDWRTQLPHDSRQRTVDRIIETLKRCLHFSGQEGLLALKKIAVRCEKNICNADTSQQDYMQKVSLKMLALEGKSQNPIPNNPNCNGSSEPASVDSTARTGNANVGDWQEEVYQKSKAVKEMYSPALNKLYQMISTKLQQQDDSVVQHPRLDSEQVDRLKRVWSALGSILRFLQISKSNILPGFNEKLGSCEKQIIKFVNLYKSRNPDPTIQQTQSQTRKRRREGGSSTMPVVKAEASEEVPLERPHNKYYEDLNAERIALLVEHDTLRAVIKKQDEELMLARAALEAKENELQQVLAEQKKMG